MPKPPRNILVTSALPYANGEIHLGHMVESIQTDIWVRFQKLQGHQCLYICGSDAHGTPIMISAEKAGVAPEKMIAEISQKQQEVFNEFFIGFDNFYTTHSEENKELASYIYLQLQKRGDIITKKIEQAYDPIKNMFLPDRFVKGECPKCHAKDQYGDSCEVCGTTYSPAELINAVSVLSGATPITKESEHYFFCLENYEEMLRAWTRAGHLQEQIINKLDEWLQSGLKAWDISRDAPYFGFEIPNTKDKYFYVWLDAPIGYMASLKNLCDRNKNISFDDFFAKDSKAELYHFVGKDIVYFHALFWPAMLDGAGFRTPTAIFAHGFLTVDGQKMSKSRGTFINGRDYLNHFDPEQLRYYFAAKLTNRVEDIDLNLEDFMNRINSDLVGKLVNIASRCAGFIHKLSDGLLADKLHNADLFQYCVDAGNKIAAYYENREYNHAIRIIMECADKTNQYIDEHKPWSLAKQEGQEKNVQAICSQGINLFRLLMIYLKPVLPKMAEKVETFLNISPLVWDDHRSPLLNHRINNFELLMKRIDSTQISALREANKI